MNSMLKKDEAIAESWWAKQKNSFKQHKARYIAYAVILGFAVYGFVTLIHKF